MSPDATDDPLALARAALLRVETELRQLHGEFVRLLETTQAVQAVAAEASVVMARQNAVIEDQSAMLQRLRAGVLRPAPGFRAAPSGKHGRARR